MDVRIQAALIASAVTMSGIFLKDYIFIRLAERRTSHREKGNIYRQYSEPLAKASEALFWRLNEILNEKNRAHFLLRSEIANEFDDYKYKSTLYRLAALLGWIHAIKKEQSYLKPTNEKSLKSINSALLELEKSLADGKHAEVLRLEVFTHLLDIDIPNENIQSLSITIERIFREHLKSCNQESVSSLSKHQKYALCFDCVEVICPEINVQREVIEKKLDKIIKGLSVKEAWIYRDWQSGIGELMTEKSESENRNYDVIGFKEFEKILKSEDEEDTIWMSRIERVFENLDVTKESFQDIRVDLLADTHISISKLILSVNNSSINESPFSISTVQAAEAILSELNTRTPTN